MRSEMRKRIRRVPSPALVISVIALVFAIGGGIALASLTTGQTKKLIVKVLKKRASHLSVNHAVTADSANAIGAVTYVKGTVVSAPGNGGSGFAESLVSTANCPPGTVVIGTGAHTDKAGVEDSEIQPGKANASDTGLTQVRGFFDNFTTTAGPNNFVIAICAAAKSTSNPAALSRR
jgi:hypothetical protein